MSESYNAIFAAAQEAFDISLAKSLATQAISNIEYDLHRPSVLYRPKLMLEGNQWMALYGDDFRTGFAAFGDSPALAMEAFDKAWHEKIDRTIP